MDKASEAGKTFGVVCFAQHLVRVPGEVDVKRRNEEGFRVSGEQAEESSIGLRISWLPIQKLCVALTHRNARWHALGQFGLPRYRSSQELSNQSDAFCQ